MIVKFIFEFESNVSRPHSLAHTVHTKSQSPRKLRLTIFYIPKVAFLQILSIERAQLIVSAIVSGLIAFSSCWLWCEAGEWKWSWSINWIKIIISAQNSCRWRHKIVRVGQSAWCWCWWWWWIVRVNYARGSCDGQKKSSRMKYLSVEALAKRRRKSRSD